MTSTEILNYTHMTELRIAKQFALVLKSQDPKVYLNGVALDAQDLLNALETCCDKLRAHCGLVKSRSGYVTMGSTSHHVKRESVRCQATDSGGSGESGTPIELHKMMGGTYESDTGV